MQITLRLCPEASFEYAFRLVSGSGEQTGRLLPALPGEDALYSGAPVLDVPEGEFELLLVPIRVLPPAASDAGGILGALADKALRKLSASGRDYALRVGARYRIENAYDGCTLTLVEREYLFDAWDHLDILELYPVSYVYPELRLGDRLLTPTEWNPRNRKEFLSFTRKATLVYDPTVLSFLLLRPLQITRARILSRPRRVRRVLRKFYRLSEDERTDRFRRMEEKL